MLVKTKAILCALSLCTVVSVHGEGTEEDNEIFMMKNWRKRRVERRAAVKIGSRIAPSFKSRRPNLQVEQNLEQTIDIANVASNPQNRDLSEGFDEATFWEDYLYTGQVNSLPPTYAPVKVTKPPTYAPTVTPTLLPVNETKAPVPPPTFDPVPPPPTEAPAPPTDAPACRPICKYNSFIS